MRTLRRIVLCATVLSAAAAPARASHITSVTLDGSSIVGNSNQSITVTIGFVIDPNEITGFFEYPGHTSVFVGIGGQVPGYSTDIGCGDYAPIGASTLTCVLKSDPSSTAYPEPPSAIVVPLLATSRNFNYRPGDPGYDTYNTDPGMGASMTLAPPSYTLTVSP